MKLKIALVFTVVTSATLSFAAISAWHTPHAPQHIRASRTTISPCEAGSTSSRVARVKIRNWGSSTYDTYPSSSVPAQATPVDVEVVEALRGALPKSMRIYLPGPFNSASGEFLDGTLAVGQEAYVGLITIKGLDVIRSQAFWPISSDPASHLIPVGDFRSVSENTLRAEIVKTSNCAAAPSVTPPEPEGVEVDYSHVTVDAGT